MSDFLAIFTQYAPLFLEASWVTLRLSAAAIVMAMFLGSLIAAMAMGRVRALRWIATAYIGLVRGTPLITQIFIIYFGLVAIVALPAFWAGALALAFHNSAYIAEIIRSGFQAVPSGLTEAARSLGMSRTKTLKRVQAPLALRTTLPVLGNQYIIAIKDSSLVSFIGMTELFQTSRNVASSTYQELTAYIIVALYYLVIVLALTAVVNWLEHRLSAHRRPATS
ncbi:MAG: amino acid ABC transporter permease [Ornithinimicrobium sp.]|uniref:amino acid ABC transporter permease n=1 Tax=Ornithinimicrobium sp. TaxID=1977084 RepID=UPI0026DED280|nr:amino acid ABC transporter permease [Ornithinimicrobium sp.]MDO5739064.1 amino acid ABC transporter permease [Ornithinimicrobium sp.]